MATRKTIEKMGQANKLELQSGNPKQDVFIQYGTYTVDTGEEGQVWCVGNVSDEPPNWDSNAEGSDLVGTRVGVAVENNNITRTKYGTIEGYNSDNNDYEVTFDHPNPANDPDEVEYKFFTYVEGHIREKFPLDWHDFCKQCQEENLVLLTWTSQTEGAAITEDREIIIRKTTQITDFQNELLEDHIRTDPKEVIFKCLAVRKSTSNKTKYKAVCSLSNASTGKSATLGYALARGVSTSDLSLDFAELQSKLRQTEYRDIAVAITDALSLVRCRVPHLSAVTLEDLAASPEMLTNIDLAEEVMNQVVQLCGMMWRVQNVRSHKRYLQAFWMKDYREGIAGSISFFCRMDLRDGKWQRFKRKFDWTI